MKTRLALLLAALAGCASQPLEPPLAVRQPAQERNQWESVGASFSISTQGKASSLAAQKMFDEGGNIIDAAIAASFAISVERPNSTGIGGGGFLLFHEAKTGKTHAVDFRERAPLAASKDMYLNEKGDVIPERSVNGIHSVATPGLVAGLIEMHGKWGKLPLAKVIAPAIEIAEQGTEVTPEISRALEWRKAVLARDPGARAIFLKPDLSPYAIGEKIVQKDLAETLRSIVKKGKKGFYSGPVAKAILDFSKEKGGALAARDFDSYKVKWRAPVRGNFRGNEVLSMPPPSSGGVHVLQVLNMLENDPLADLGFLSAKAIHRTASALQLAFADRAVYLGDPDFVKVPDQWLTSKAYALSRRASIEETRARPSAEVQAGTVPKDEHLETTHFSILDSEGNAVSSTQTINAAFGSGVVVPGTGVLLNDEMDDFSAKPGVANIYGGLGGAANAIAPGKTPLSSMSPTIVLRDGRPIMAVGAPGGTRIISCVAETILNVLAYRLPPYEAVAGVRFHHQWQPDELQIDSPGPGAGVEAELTKMGYKLKVAPNGVPCKVMLVVREGDLLHGVSDPRDAGTAVSR